MAKKLVEREYIFYLLDKLFSLQMKASGELKNELSSLENYVRKNILEEDKESLNEVKRVIYKRMKEASTKEESKQWADFYKSL